MHSIENALPLSDSGFVHPPLSTEPAEKLKQLLLELSRQPEHDPFRSILRSAADSIREKAFGYNRKTTRKKILKLLSEFTVLEIVDITDETRISEKEVRAALEELIAEGRVTRGRRRRWQEPGKHYNEIFSRPSATLS
jgi:hypothetical protein